MSEYVVKLPDVGEGIAEAEIVEWHVAVGDTIAEDQVMVEVMTDKATVELPSPVAGVVTSLGGDVGDVLAVGSPLIRIETEAPKPRPIELPTALADAAADDAPSAAAAPRGQDGTSGADRRRTRRAAPRTAARTARRGRPRRRRCGSAQPRWASTSATVTGTGPDGRVVHDDLDTVLDARPAPRRGTTSAETCRPSSAGDDTVDEVKVIGLRRNIAQRMQISPRRGSPTSRTSRRSTSPRSNDCERSSTRSGSTASRRLTLLPFLMRAVVVAVVDFPQMNARYDDDNGVVNRHRAVHLGVATQTAKGLMVPVVSMPRRRRSVGLRRRGRPPLGGGTQRQDHARGTEWIDDHHQQPRRARRDRVDPDHQLSRGRHHRCQQDRRPTRVRRRHACCRARS